MSYTYFHHKLAGLFPSAGEEIQIPESNMRIRNIRFESHYPRQKHLLKPGDSSFCFEDSKIEENWSFDYPVFVPDDKKNNQAIILLHGLNERDWTKYLPWAYFLAEKTKRTVILFPLAFHINRGKKEWSDPRSMLNLVKSRKSIHQDIIQLSFANVALSNRLTEDPMRFYRAGLQSASDLLQLLDQIKKGNHPLLLKNTQVNFLGYSIGAFLTQILFMANPDNMLANSKAVLFCGGASFNKMSGTSKLIMDNLAYKKLIHFYPNQFESHSNQNSNHYRTKRLEPIIQSFKAMIPLPSFRQIKETAMAGLSKKITAIGLLKDKVIPIHDIRETIKDSRGKTFFTFHWADFPYDYSHENPFPVFKTNQKYAVDKSFDRIFSAISLAIK